MDPVFAYTLGAVPALPVARELGRALSGAGSGDVRGAARPRGRALRGVRWVPQKVRSEAFWFYGGREEETLWDHLVESIL